MKQRSISLSVTIAVLSSLLLAGSARAADPDQNGGQPDAKAARKAARSACRDDFRRVCGGVRPGGGRIVACLQEHEADLSPACRQALQDARAAREAAQAPGQGE